MLVVAVANQKGGVGKTTCCVNLGAALGQMGCNVLVVDMDPQGHAGLCLGVRGEASRGGTARELRKFLEGQRDLRPRQLEGLDLLAADEELEAFEGERDGGDGLLRDSLSMGLGNYAFIVVDSPPAAGRLGRMALIAAGVHGLINGGSTGEYYAQTMQERLEMASLARDLTKGRVIHRF